MDTREPSFRNFIAAFRNHVGEAMSGGFSVPFAAIGVVSAFFAKENSAALVAAIVFLALGIAAMWFAAYRIWAVERGKVIVLDKDEQREIVRSSLGDLRARGVTLRNEASPGALTANQWPGWVKRAVAWDAEVVKAIKNVSDADALWFATADIMPPPRIELMIDAIMTPKEANDAVRAFQLHDFRLVKLAQLITGKVGNIFVRR